MTDINIREKVKWKVLSTSVEAIRHLSMICHQPTDVEASNPRKKLEPKQLKVIKQNC